MGNGQRVRSVEPDSADAVRCACPGTDHVFEDGDVTAAVGERAVPRGLPAVHERLLGLGPADVRGPPDPGQQPGGAAHRVVAGPGGLLVPGPHRLAGHEQRHGHAHRGEPDAPFHVRTRDRRRGRTEKRAGGPSRPVRLSRVVRFYKGQEREGAEERMIRLRRGAGGSASIGWAAV